ncbi:MAG: hypothetical protein LC127_06245 [Chitinophagales bacterium]|nr:hypothetical protein [Chitinophagales bacterium]
MKKLSVTEKKIRIRVGKRVKHLEDKIVPPIPWVKSLMAFLATIIKKAKTMCKK